MKQEVIFVLLNQYTDREPSFLNVALYTGFTPEAPGKYYSRGLFITKENSYVPYLN